MHRSRHLTAMALALTAFPAVAAETHFGFKPIIVNGSSAVSATALNNRDLVVGYFIDLNGNYAGFLKSGSVITVMPPLCKSGVDCFARPTAVNAAGDVVGYAYEGYTLGFLWRAGHYVAKGTVNMDYSAGEYSIGINNRGVEYYDYTAESNSDFEVFVGKPGAFTRITPPGSYPVITNINDNGTVVGVDGTSGLFLWKSGEFSNVLPPGGDEAYSGVLNAQDDVAGLFVDKRGLTHGFVYHDQGYTTFDVPGDPSTVYINSVNGINNSGRVVGVYTNTKSHEQGLFLYNGATVTTFGHYGDLDGLQIALNDEGVMIVADSSQAGITSRRVLCGGAGC